MLKLNSIWHGAIFAVAITLVLSASVIQFNQSNDVSATGGTCDSGTAFSVPVSGEIVHDMQHINIYVPSFVGGTVVQVQNVKFFTNNSFISNGTQTSQNFWETNWNTLSFPNGTAQITAKVFSNTNTLICTTAPVSVNIQNQNDPPTGTGNFFLVRKSPNVAGWTGVTNIPKDFKIEAKFDSGSGPNTVNSDTLFSWRLASGSVGALSNPKDRSQVQYFSGPNAGNATLIVDAQYAGFMASKQFQITIDPVTATNFPDLDADEVEQLLDEVSTETQDSTTSDDPSKALTSDPELTNCLVTVIGVDKYKSIVSGKSRLTFTELKDASRCFVITRYILPANVAPIEPSRLRDLRENKDSAQVDNVEQLTLDDNSKDSLLVSGKSLPNKTLLLYIFSEPLVLTTTSDQNGNWTYVLEDPLAPGEHEVFVAVEENDGEAVRSSAFTFNVAQAASIDGNPSGLSLTLDLSNPQSNSTIYYVSAVVAVMLVGLGLFILIVRGKSSTDRLDESKVEPEKDS